MRLLRATFVARIRHRSVPPIALRRPAAVFAAVFLPAMALAQNTVTLEVVVHDVPAAATELVVIADFTPPAPPPSADGPPQRQRQRRAAQPAVFKTSVPTAGAASVRASLAVTPAPNFRVRAVAIAGAGPMVRALAGATRREFAIATEGTTELALPLVAPTLALAPSNPASVPAGAKFTLTGIVTDPGGCLDGKDRMRAWASAGAPATENFSGLQTSTIEVTRDGDNMAFSIELTAPAAPGPLYLQFGELSAQLSGDDGTRAVFLVVPDLAAGGRAPMVRVDPAPPPVAGAVAPAVH